MYKTSRSRKTFRSNSFRGRRKKDNSSRFKKLFLLISITTLCIYGAKTILSQGNDIAAEATIEIRRGVLEFSLDGDDLWTRGNSGQKFLEGDRLRCTGNCETSVQLLDGGSVVVLAPNTEITFSKLRQKSSGEKNIILQLDKGTLWGTISDDFANKNSHFIVKTATSEIDAQGTIFNINTKDDDLIRVLRGKAELRTIKNDNKSDPLEMSMGQEVLLDDAAQAIFDTDNVVKVIEKLDSSFEESEWNLKNLELFSPQEAAAIRHRIELSASPTTQDPTKNGLDSPIIQSPVSGVVIPAVQDILKLKGTAPTGAYRISVNGYILTKFQPGDRKWSYFASKKLGTLVAGKNTFKVVSISRDGKESAPATIEVTYNATSEPVVVAEATSDFPVPVIQFPSLADATQTFETTESVLRITGIVDPRTTAVEVNGFRLKKFQPDNIEWKYIANANYGNMVVGENTYNIVAIGENNERSSATLRVNYTPQ